ncbi:MAG: methylated-DNA--[protein]-cysteine S-methyltransferase [Microbacteriaceae bacterium]|nr:methylated-DNA--[protein]-cysteine S-methyltransferase [Microbacteriaceae bacterium]MCL2795495.1 methylated-DNA--[protein]-cysteine S-methyltransferase [Microbacteriaceae bacterium]
MKPAIPLFLARTDSPIGRIELASDGDAITSLSIARDGHLPLEALPENPNAVLEEAVRQLGEYFAGTRVDFDLPLHLAGTEFQRAVWARLQQLPFGEFTTYGEIGLELGRPTAGRAVGGAVGANPVPLIIGCHRVLASNGAVTGYSAGDGITTKLWLLAHEGITLAA